jgi:hypothetical protein
MKKKKVTKKNKVSCSSMKTPCGNAIYFFGFVGSAIYYVSTATGFWMGVLGILKSFVWPAFLVFELLKYLGA